MPPANEQRGFGTYLSAQACGRRLILMAGAAACSPWGRSGPLHAAGPILHRSLLMLRQPLAGELLGLGNVGGSHIGRNEIAVIDCLL